MALTKTACAFERNFRLISVKVQKEKRKRERSKKIKSGRRRKSSKKTNFEVELMAEKKIDDSPFLSKMENFEISDKKNKVSKGEIKNVYRSLENEFNFEEEKVENEMERDGDIREDGDDEKKDFTYAKSSERKEKSIRTIKIDRRNLKKMFSSQFFTQTLTGDSSTNSISELKINKKYAIWEFLKTFFLITLFFLTSYFTFFYILNYYFGKTNICGHVDLYNYKYENGVRFIPSASNKKNYIFTGKFPFDVMTYKLRKEALKNSMNEELEKHRKENPEGGFELIENLDNHQMQIVSFMKYDNKMKCEKKIFDLYKPFLLKTTDANMKDFNFILNQVNYSFITNPYNVPEGKLYTEVSNFVKKSESKNKICYITSYLKSLRDDNITDGGRVLSENNESSSTPTEDKGSGLVEKLNDITAVAENIKKYFIRGNSKGDKDNKVGKECATSSSYKDKLPQRKIVFLYDYYDNNFVDLVIAIYNMQYGNTYNNLKEHWEEIKKNFKVLLGHKLQHNTKRKSIQITMCRSLEVIGIHEGESKEEETKKMNNRSIVRQK
ncbi:conserved Plasmodium protein, unknown function [Plasmodium ovale curtisi]|uniref:Uncharacterized protein n=1 Tax=Plasmodium ovale curtisi TaxID=864141 RepID=A0A1A8VNG4_PLAOA|nr:conserved Plasmodium protein, unknown function [Plasmodium ovale curtisi]